MSLRNNNQKQNHQQCQKQQQDQRKMFCPICTNAGLPESICTSHFVRETKDPRSKITCPTLLQLQCGYCKKHGHTTKHCPVIAHEDKCHSKMIKKQQYEQKISAQPQRSMNMANLFDVLDKEDQEQEQQGQIQDQGQRQSKEEFPELHQQVRTIHVPIPLEYAKIIEQANNPVKIQVRKQIVIDPNQIIQSNQSNQTIQTNKPRFNWADAVDSDDEEDGSCW